MRPPAQGRFAHVECEERATGTALTEEGVADADWFCSQVCRLPYPRCLTLFAFFSTSTRTRTSVWDTHLAAAPWVASKYICLQLRDVSVAVTHTAHRGVRRCTRRWQAGPTSGRRWTATSRWRSCATPETAKAHTPRPCHTSANAALLSAWHAWTLGDHRFVWEHGAIAYEAQPELLCCTAQQARARRRRP